MRYFLQVPRKLGRRCTAFRTAAPARSHKRRGATRLNHRLRAVAAHSITYPPRVAHLFSYLARRASYTAKVAHSPPPRAQPLRGLPCPRILPSHRAHFGLSRTSDPDAPGRFLDLRTSVFPFLDPGTRARGPIPPISGSGTHLPVTCDARTAGDARRADAPGFASDSPLPSEGPKSATTRLGQSGADG